jgi:hypothetical protein
MEIIDEHERILDTGRFGTDRDGYQHMVTLGRRHPDRTWAIEGCNGIGRHIAQRLLADGETMVNDAKRLAAGPGRKTGATTESSATDVRSRRGSANSWQTRRTCAQPTRPAARPCS